MAAFPLDWCSALDPATEVNGAAVSSVSLCQCQCQDLRLGIAAQLLQPLQVKTCGLGAVFNPKFAQYLADVAFDGGFA